MTEEQYITKYNDRRAEIEAQLHEGERIVQCLDKKSFNARYYNPCWLVTSEARIFSLYDMCWREPYQDKAGCGYRDAEGIYSQKPYYLYNTNKYAKECAGVDFDLKVYIHRIVANYFCDKNAIEQYGEHDCEVHHIIPYNYDRSCTENNRASNLQYISKDTHREVTQVSEGNIEGNFGVKLMANTTAHLKRSGNAGVKYNLNEDTFEIKVLLNT